jgi:hypothetical protein
MELISHHYPFTQVGIDVGVAIHREHSRDMFLEMCSVKVF